MTSSLPEPSSSEEATKLPTREPSVTLDTAELQFAQSVVRRFPNDVQARLKAASLYARAGLFREADEELRAALRLDPHSFEAHRGRVEVYRAVNYLDREIEALKKLIALYPRYLEAYLQLAGIYRQLHWSAEALKVLRQAEPIAAGSSEFYLSRAYILYARTEFQRGIDELLALIKRDPTNDKAYNLLSYCYWQQNRFPEAINAIQQAIRLKPQEPLYHQRLGVILISQPQPERYREALPAFLKAAELDPQNWVTRYWLGVCYRHTGRLDEARQELEKVAAASLHIESVALELGQLYLTQGKKKEGQQLLDWHRQAQQRANAMRSALNLLRVQPQKPEGHFQAAQLYLEEGNFAFAIVEARKTLELNPQYPQAKDLLLQALEQAGRTAEARKLRGESR
ncbi:MAG: tetratricopeptide repeat protein [Abditibacteriales bacterium]|nr:tetratricopeptide repeat protein [Abditibacteriales bacterium]MDW8366948.1 tetratricopeptide repeat protein [Abditibacteriales bacterium]